MTKKMNRILVAATLCVMTVVISVGFKQAYFPNPKDAGEKQSNAAYLNKSRDKSKVLAKVGEETIYENDLKQARIGREDNDIVSDSKLLDILIESKLLLTEGKKQNLVPSDSEIKTGIEATKTAIENDEDARKNVDSIIQALGVSEDEYWNNYVYNTYKDMMTINHLRNKANDNKELDEMIKKLKTETKIEKF